VWNVTLSGETGITAPATATVPGRLDVSGRPSASEAGFVVLTRGTDVRRIPFFVEVSHPALGGERHIALSRPGVYSGTTRGGSSLVTQYRYPTEGDASYAGPERVYRVRVGAVANFGIAVLSGTAVPHVVFPNDENRLAGYTALPLDINPYRNSFGSSRRIAGAVLPAPGTYDIVFDTRSAAGAGPFRFRFWSNDVTPPQLRIVSANAGRVRVAATDAGAGVDPASITASLDGRNVRPQLRGAVITIAAPTGRHRLVIRVADYQETKNMEDVQKILPNTRTLSAVVTVR
jgi:hypothetical protein